MKKFLPLFLSFVFLAFVTKAQYVTILDNGFRQFLQQQYPSCLNSSGMLDTTCSTIISETSIKPQMLRYFQVNSLEGIQYFKSLSYLDCSECWISSIPSLPNSLKYLNCSFNSIQALPALPNTLLYIDCSQNMSLHSPLSILPSSLTYLDCSYTPLDALPALPNSLSFLNCSNTDLSIGLPPLPNSLTYLDCSYNTFYTLPLLPSALKHLDCSHMLSLSAPTLPNSLTYYNSSHNQDYLSNASFVPAILPPILDTLICSANNLAALPTLPNTLKVLDCSYNSIAGTLPSLPASLIILNCSNNKLSNCPILPSSLASLDCSSNILANLPVLPNSLTYFYCSFNKLTSLPTLPVSLISLSCYSNQLASLPTLPNTLETLDCSSNMLANLPSLPTSLINLSCGSNQLTSLPSLPNNLQSLLFLNTNVSCLPVLPSTINTLSFSIEKIHCIPSSINNILYITINDSAGLDETISPSSLPLCNPTNNINHCLSFPVMDGSAFYDNNSNGIKDAGELYMPYVKMQLSNGASTFTNSNGYYQIAATDGTGAYTLFATPPQYYKAVPVLLNYNFTNFDTLVTHNIAMQPTELIDNLSLDVFGYQWHARPGFDFPISFNYMNVGTTTLTPTITFNYDNSRLIYDSSSNPNVINNGSTLSLSETNFTPGQSNSFVAYFTVKTTDVIGDTIKTIASIAANAFTDTINIATAISGSYDPNDKEATPQLTPEQVTKGKSINYTIRFQNTGNDTAFNIVIADTLSSLLQANTLQMIGSSQPCKVTVTGNIVFFEFLNVLLPDNKTNDIGSNGYVSFSVQPQSSVSKGTTINNIASIYFDYNTPIITNTASTSIQEPNSTVPVRLLSFTAFTQTGTTNTLLHWSTASEINTKTFVIEQSSDGINFTTLSTVSAKGYGANSYTYTVTDNAATYYRLKMVDNNGQYAYSPIVSIKTSQDAGGIVILNNPAVNFVTIKNNAASLNNTEAKILDSHGAIVKRFVLQPGIQNIDVSMLPSGGYYIETLLTPLKFVIAR